VNYQLVIVTYQDIIQDGSWDGPEKVHCPTITSVGWMVDSSDPVKIAGTLDDEKKPCAILAIPRGCVLAINEVSIEHPTIPSNIC
jgi:hypothetical protein